MSFEISPQMKIVALVGLLAALALGAGSMLLGRSQSGTPAATPPVVLRHFHRKAVTPAAHAGAKTRSTVPAKVKAKAPVAKPAPASTVAARPVVKPAAAVAQSAPPVTDGLPTPLDVLLHTHRIVVVALYDPEVASERTIALPEARAGAAAANAGFLAVDVLDDRVAGPLTAIAGNGTILPDPGVMIYRQPGTLVNTIQGFVDRDSVAEAVANAIAAPAPVAAPATTTAATTAPSVAPVAPAPTTTGP